MPIYKSKLLCFITRFLFLSSLSFFILRVEVFIRALLRTYITSSSSSSFHSEPARAFFDFPARNDKPRHKDNDIGRSVGITLTPVYIPRNRGTKDETRKVSAEVRAYTICIHIHSIPQSRYYRFVTACKSLPSVFYDFSFPARGNIRAGAPSANNSRN